MAIANFQGQLPFDSAPPTAQGTLEVFEVSAKDGSELDKVTVPITFGSALIDNFEGFIVLHRRGRRHALGDRRAHL